MNKIVGFLMLSLMSVTSYANEQVLHVNSTGKMHVHQSWSLEYAHTSNYQFVIENPSHSRLFFSINVHPTSMDGRIHSSSINLYCRDKKVVVKPGNHLVTCDTIDNIKFDILPQSDDPDFTGQAFGEFDLEMK